jgi:RNA polymerase primary sigma factor
MRNLQITQSITNRDSQSIEAYFNEIGKEPMISAQEEVILAQKIRQGDQAALEKLTKANLRFVVSVAKKYQHRGLLLSDLISEGNLGLIKAAYKFDETRGFKFISFAVWWIRESILAALTENARMIRLPTNRVNEITKINKAFITLEQETLRDPTHEQVADYLGTTVAKVNDALVFAPWTSSIDAPFGEDEYTLLDKVPLEGAGTDQALLAESFEVEMNYLLSKLSDKERKVIELCYGISSGQAMKPVDISKQIGMSTESVRVIKKNAMGKLRCAAAIIKP